MYIDNHDFVMAITGGAYKIMYKIHMLKLGFKMRIKRITG